MKTNKKPIDIDGESYTRWGNSTRASKYTIKPLSSLYLDPVFIPAMKTDAKRVSGGQGSLYVVFRTKDYNLLRCDQGQLYRNSKSTWKHGPLSPPPLT